MNSREIFAINKPVGMTSQRAVQIIKYWARRKTGNKKIKVGHAGTLDPLASGVLVVGVGRKNTKDLNNVVVAQKEYIANIFLGVVSETDDAEGKKTIINDQKKPMKDEIEKVIEKFIGTIEQRPSAYSAIKIDGKEAYKRVRQGEKIKMKKRKVQIDEIEILSYTYPNLKICVTCGKGTYIRSLARDIGERLGTGAYLSGLVRTRVGTFVLDDVHDLKKFAMHIAVHAAELDGERIDGTRVYINEVVKRLGDMAQDDEFFIYHQSQFNKRLMPPEKDNYHVKTLASVPLWTQTRFAYDIFWQKPDVLWVPVHDMPFIHSKRTKIIVTIHDLAFKIFPQTFPQSDVRKLNFLTDRAVKKADHLIAVSKATKRDLLRFYPELSEEKITVVPHGINTNDWQRELRGDMITQTMEKYHLQTGKYIIHIGAIQPRKNLVLLIDAFEQVKEMYPDIKLVLAGGNGWLWENIHAHARKSNFASDIIFTGNITFTEVQILMRHAQVFVFPSLYEGFGIAGLEACAAAVPIVAAKSSSLPEVLGNAAVYFDPKSTKECAIGIIKVLGDEELRKQLYTAGLLRAKKFTWDKCAKRTLDVLRA